MAGDEGPPWDPGAEARRAAEAARSGDPSGTVPPLRALARGLRGPGGPPAALALAAADGLARLEGCLEAQAVVNDAAAAVELCRALAALLGHFAGPQKAAAAEAGDGAGAPVATTLTAEGAREGLDGLAARLVRRRVKTLHLVMHAGGEARARAVLGLLRGVALRSPVLAYEVVTGVNWVKMLPVKLLKPTRAKATAQSRKRDRGATGVYGTRRDLLELLLPLLESRDRRVADAVLAEKDLVLAALQHLSHDPPPFVRRILDRVFAIATSGSLGRYSQKERRQYFTKATLLQLSVVATWEGDGDRGAAAGVAYRMLAALCTEPRFGVLEPDLLEPAAVLPGPHVLSGRVVALLLKLQVAQYVPHFRLFLDAVQARPLLGVAVAHLLPVDLNPKPSTFWTATTAILIHILDASRAALGSVPPHAHGAPERRAPSEDVVEERVRVEPYVARIFFPSYDRKNVAKGLRHASLFVKFRSLCLLEALLRACGSVADHLHRSGAGSPDAFLEAARPLLPGVAELLACYADVEKAREAGAVDADSMETLHSDLHYQTFASSGDGGEEADPAAVLEDVGLKCLEILEAHARTYPPDAAAAAEVLRSLAGPGGLNRMPRALLARSLLQDGIFGAAQCCELLEDQTRVQQALLDAADAADGALSLARADLLVDVAEASGMFTGSPGEFRLWLDVLLVGSGAPERELVAQFLAHALSQCLKRAAATWDAVATALAGAPEEDGARVRALGAGPWEFSPLGLVAVHQCIQLSKSAKRAASDKAAVVQYVAMALGGVCKMQRDPALMAFLVRTVFPAAFGPSADDVGRIGRALTAAASWHEVERGYAEVDFADALQYLAAQYAALSLDAEGEGEGEADRAGNLEAGGLDGTPLAGGGVPSVYHLLLCLRWTSSGDLVHPDAVCTVEAIETLVRLRREGRRSRIFSAHFRAILLGCRWERLAPVPAVEFLDQVVAADGLFEGENWYVHGALNSVVRRCWGELSRLLLDATEPWYADKAAGVLLELAPVLELEVLQTAFDFVWKHLRGRKRKRAGEAGGAGGVEGTLVALAIGLGSGILERTRGAYSDSYRTVVGVARRLQQCFSLCTASRYEALPHAEAAPGAGGDAPDSDLAFADLCLPALLPREWMEDALSRAATDRGFASAMAMLARGLAGSSRNCRTFVGLSRRVQDGAWVDRFVWEWGAESLATLRHAVAYLLERGDRDEGFAKLVFSAAWRLFALKKAPKGTADVDPVAFFSESGAEDAALEELQLVVLESMAACELSRGEVEALLRDVRKVPKRVAGVLKGRDAACAALPWVPKHLEVLGHLVAKTRLDVGVDDPAVAAVLKAVDALLAVHGGDFADVAAGVGGVLDVLLPPDIAHAPRDNLAAVFSLCEGLLARHFDAQACAEAVTGVLDALEGLVWGDRPGDALEACQSLVDAVIGHPSFFGVVTRKPGPLPDVIASEPLPLQSLLFGAADAEPGPPGDAGGAPSTARTALMTLLSKLLQTLASAKADLDPAWTIDARLRKLLLIGYGGTLHQDDVHLLASLRALDHLTGATTLEEHNFLWGEAVQMQLYSGADSPEKAIGILLDNAQYDPRRAALTAQFLPLKYGGHGVDALPADAAERAHGALYHDAYDPEFLFHFLDFHLDRGSVAVRPLIGAGLLSAVIAGTAAENREVRARSYGLLDKVAALMQEDDFKEKPQVGALLLSLKNAIVEKRQRIPVPIAMFVAEALLICLQPTSYLYPVVNKALVKRPFLPLNDMPVFFQLYASGTTTKGLERAWLFKYVLVSLINGKDKGVFRRRMVLEALVSHEASDDCTALERRLIWKILLRACGIPRYCRDMFLHAKLGTALLGSLRKAMDAERAAGGAAAGGAPARELSAHFRRLAAVLDAALDHPAIRSRLGSGPFLDVRLAVFSSLRYAAARNPADHDVYLRLVAKAFAGAGSGRACGVLAASAAGDFLSVVYDHGLAAESIDVVLFYTAGVLAGRGPVATALDAAVDALAADAGGAAIVRALAWVPRQLHELLARASGESAAELRRLCRAYLAWVAHAIARVPLGPATDAVADCLKVAACMRAHHLRGMAPYVLLPLGAFVQRATAAADALDPFHHLDWPMGESARGATGPGVAGPAPGADGLPAAVHHLLARVEAEPYRGVFAKFAAAAGAARPPADCHACLVALLAGGAVPPGTLYGPAVNAVPWTDLLVQTLSKLLMLL